MRWIDGIDSLRCLIKLLIIGHLVHIPHGISVSSLILKSIHITVIVLLKHLNLQMAKQFQSFRITDLNNNLFKMIKMMTCMYFTLNFSCFQQHEINISSIHLELNLQLTLAAHNSCTCV